MVIDHTKKRLPNRSVRRKRLSSSKRNSWSKNYTAVKERPNLYQEIGKWHDLFQPFLQKLQQQNHQLSSPCCTKNCKLLLDCMIESISLSLLLLEIRSLKDGKNSDTAELPFNRNVGWKYIQESESRLQRKDSIFPTSSIHA